MLVTADWVLPAGCDPVVVSFGSITSEAGALQASESWHFNLRNTAEILAAYAN